MAYNHSKRKQKVIKLGDAKLYIENLYKSYQVCRAMERTGSSKATIGFAFYKAMCELFDEPVDLPPPTVFPPIGPADPNDETQPIKPIK
jgi:hypothetical protein